MRNREALDSAGNQLQPRLVLDRLEGGLVTFVGKIDLEILVQINLIEELVQGPVRETLELKPVTHKQLLQVVDRLGRHDELVHQLFRQIMREENITQGHVPLDLARESFDQGASQLAACAAGVALSWLVVETEERD